MIRPFTDCQWREVTSRDIEAAIQDDLMSLSEVDNWCDSELENLLSCPDSVQDLVTEKIEQRSRQNREPYVQHLAHLYRLIVAARIFGDIDKAGRDGTPYRATNQP